MVKKTAKLFSRAILAAVLCGCVLLPGAAAARDTAAPHYGYTCSAWAGEEIDRAGGSGLLSAALPDDLRGNVTRAQFCEMALQFTAEAQGYDIESFLTLCREYLQPGTAFTDCAEHPNAETARALGLVQGRGNGIFDPESNITRQEAAVMLARVYAASGLEVPAQEASYTDMDSVADYAKDSVGSVTALGVMHGVGENCFSPLTGYTGEQCALTFLRLYENDALRAAVSPRFTRAQAQDYINGLTAGAAVSGVGYTEVYRAEGDLAAVIRLDWGGSMHATSRLLLVRADGAMRELNPDVCLNDSEFDALTPALAMDNPRFSEDGTRFECEFTLPEDAYRTEVQGVRYLAHQQGTYLYTMDLQTGRESTALICGVPPVQ